MRRSRYRLAEFLVWCANQLTKPKTVTMEYNYWPIFRPIDQQIKQQGSYVGHKYSCGAYSYEHLKSLVEQDGPDGFGARATIKWLIGEEGWKDVADMDSTELRRTLAMSGIDMEDAD